LPDAEASVTFRPSMSAKVVVVGAGVAGLSCARELVRRGLEVTLLDKGRAAGGRITTRRRDGHAFDLGAQYLTTREPSFLAHVAELRERGILAPWAGRIVAIDPETGARSGTEQVERLVGVPGMNAFPLALAEGLDVRSSHRVERLVLDDGRWSLEVSVAESGVTLPPTGARPPLDAGARGPGALERARLGPFDAVIVSAPPSQAAGLVREVAPGLADRVAGVALEPCFALGVAFEGQDAERLASLPFVGAFVGRDEAPSTSGLSWVARDSSKPGRTAGERWVLHARGDRSRALYDEPEASVTSSLLADFEALTEVVGLTPSLTTLQRWGLARATAPLLEGAFVDPRLRVGVGGDWASGGRVEGAYVSGLALAEQLVASLH
jgi:renalase